MTTELKRYITRTINHLGMENVYSNLYGIDDCLEGFTTALVSEGINVLLLEGLPSTGKTETFNRTRHALQMYASQEEPFQIGPYALTFNGGSNTHANIFDGHLALQFASIRSAQGQGLDPKSGDRTLREKLKFLPAGIVYFPDLFHGCADQITRIIEEIYEHGNVILIGCANPTDPGYRKKMSALEEHPDLVGIISYHPILDVDSLLNFCKEELHGLTYPQYEELLPELLNISHRVVSLYRSGAKYCPREIQNEVALARARLLMKQPLDISFR